MPTTLSLRDIDDCYRVRTVTDRAQQLIELQKQSLRTQLAVAATNIQAFGEIAERQEQANDHLSSLADQVHAVSRELEYLNEGIDDLNATSEATLAAVEEQTHEIRVQTRVLRHGFATLADLLLKEHETVKQIAQSLRRPYEAQAAELRDEARKWLAVGMRKPEPNAQDDFADALRLYREVVKNPIGNQDYVAWFDIGWLLWRHEKNLPEAELAFRRAERLSEPAQDAFHRLAVRHVAHMQYEQSRYEDAWQSVQKVLRGVSNHDAPFDAARYAARTGRTDDLVILLDACISRVPTVFGTMFAETDFRDHFTAIASLAKRKIIEAQHRAEVAANAAQECIEAAASWFPDPKNDVKKQEWCARAKELNRLLAQGTFHACLAAESESRALTEGASRFIETQRKCYWVKIDSNNSRINEILSNSLVHEHAPEALTKARAAVQMPIPSNARAGYDYSEISSALAASASALELAETAFRLAMNRASEVEGVQRHNAKVHEDFFKWRLVLGALFLLPACIVSGALVEATNRMGFPYILAPGLPYILAYLFIRFVCISMRKKGLPPTK